LNEQAQEKAKNDITEELNQNNYRLKDIINKMKISDQIIGGIQKEKDIRKERAKLRAIDLERGSEILEFDRNLQSTPKFGKESEDKEA